MHTTCNWFHSSYVGADQGPLHYHKVKHSKISLIMKKVIFIKPRLSLQFPSAPSFSLSLSWKCRLFRRPMSVLVGWRSQILTTHCVLHFRVLSIVPCLAILFLPPGVSSFIRLPIILSSGCPKAFHPEWRTHQSPLCILL